MIKIFIFFYQIYFSSRYNQPIVKNNDNEISALNREILSLRDTNITLKQRVVELKSQLLAKAALNYNLHMDLIQLQANAAIKLHNTERNVQINRIQKQICDNNRDMDELQRNIYTSTQNERLAYDSMTACIMKRDSLTR